MHSKSSPSTSPTAASSTSQQHISLSDGLLVSSVDLPQDAVVAYAILLPFPDLLRPTQAIEHARRAVVARNASASILDSLLSTVDIGNMSRLFIFSISSGDAAVQTLSNLRDIHFEDLTVVNVASFTPQQCFARDSSAESAPPNASDMSSSSSAPPVPLAVVYSHFIEAIRSRFIDDVDVGGRPPTTPRGRQVQRLKGGILLSPLPTASEWSAEWEHYARARPLIYAHLQVHLTPPSEDFPARLVIHPLLRPTSFLPLGLSLPLPTGTPICLLPYGTPAYYLTTYSGPSSGLVKHFNEHLVGLGVSGWDLEPPAHMYGVKRTNTAYSSRSSGAKESSQPTTGLFSQLASASPAASFVIVWIAVENKQGEEKGVTAIWPMRLCVSYSTTPASNDNKVSSCGRKMLSYIPTLPPEIQPSPPPHAANVARPSLSLPLPSPLNPVFSVSASASHAATPTVPFSASTPTAIPALSPAFEIHTATSDSTPRPRVSGYPPRPALSASPTSDSLRAFKALAVTRRKNMRTVVSEVGEFVDAVARERERERERIRREREGGVGASPRSARIVSSSAMPDTSQVDNASSSAPNSGSHGPSTGPSLALPQSALAITSNPPGLTQPPAVTVSSVSAPIHASTITTTNFYPSPPQTNPPMIVATKDMQTSPDVEHAPLPPESGSNEPPDTPGDQVDGAPDPGNAPVSVPSVEVDSAMHSGTFDFGGMDTGWSDPLIRSSSDSFLGMGMDMGMDFMGMGFDMHTSMNMAGGSSSNGATEKGGSSSYNIRSNTNMDFEDFTDDDFSFFDQPSRQVVPAPIPYAVPPTPASDPLAGSGLPPAAGPGPPPLGILSPSIFSETDAGIHSSLPLGQHHLSHSGPSWLDSSALPFTDTPDTNFVPPDLLPPSAGQSPDSHGGPPTPGASIQIDLNISKHGSKGLFDPIPFAISHKEADSKYAFGKFALPPSPPPEEESFFFLEKRSIPRIDEWKSRYVAATDPRIGVVRKLRGTKRKTTEAHTPRAGAPSPVWMRDDEWDWSDCCGAGSAKDDDADSASAGESDDALDDVDQESMADFRSATCSRPATPLPAYLPIGPTLLETQFAHAHLLPLSTPLRPPGAVVDPTNLAVVPVPSVPTPVSPAATLGAANEKSKSLEAAAAMVAKEVVENPLWAEAWRASAALAPSAALSKLRTDAWHDDIYTVSQLMASVPSVQCPLDLRTIFDADLSSPLQARKDAPLQALESPMIVIGKGNATMTASPSSLRFWEKLGLSPRGGSKNVTAFVLFEDDSEENEQRVELWLQRTSAVYASKHLGSHSPGHSTHCSKDGLIPMRLDSAFRKNFANIISNLPLHGHSLVIYVVTPVRIMSLSSPLLRHVLFAIKKAQKAHSGSQLLFHLVPQNAILDRFDDPAVQRAMLECTCHAVYDRVAKPIERHMSAKFVAAASDAGLPVRRYLAPRAFTLARTSLKVQYSRAPQTLGVVDRGTLLHVGYQVSVCGRWILAVCVDERGESQEIGLWMTRTQLPAQCDEPSPGDNEGDGVSGISDSSPELHLVEKVWQFTMQCATKANIEWRIVITRLGIMEASELDAWISRVSFIDTPGVAPSLSVSILSADASTPWKFVPRSSTLSKSNRPELRSPSSSSSKHAHSLPSTLFVDAAVSTYPVFSRHPMLPLTPLPSMSDPSLIPEPPSESAASATMNQRDQASLPVLPLASSALVHVPAAGGSSNLSILHVHLLHSACAGAAPSSEQDDGPSELLRDITKNFHALSVLAYSRASLSAVGASTMSFLPSHLAAVDAMHTAVSRDDDHSDGVID